MFENHGSGIGQQGQGQRPADRCSRVDDRQVWIEVGYDLEGFITDGFAGETSRESMAPFFRNGEYGRGLLAGATRVAQRIAEGAQRRRSTAPLAAARAASDGERRHPDRPGHLSDDPAHHRAGGMNACGRGAAARPLVDQRRRSVRRRLRRLVRRRAGAAAVAGSAAASADSAAAAPAAAAAERAGERCRHE